MRYRLGADSVDRRFRDHGVCEYRPPSSSLIPPYPYPFAPRLYLSTSSIYVPSRSSLPLRRASVVHRRLLEACPSTLARRSPLPPSSIVASSVIASSPLTGNGRLKTEIRAAKFGDGTRNLRSPSQAAEAHARKTARGTHEIGQLVPGCCSGLELQPKVTGTLTEKG